MPTPSDGSSQHLEAPAPNPAPQSTSIIPSISQLLCPPGEERPAPDRPRGPPVTIDHRFSPTSVSLASGRPRLSPVEGIATHPVGSSITRHGDLSRLERRWTEMAGTAGHQPDERLELLRDISALFRSSDPETDAIMEARQIEFLNRFQDLLYIDDQTFVLPEHGVWQELYLHIYHLIQSQTSRHGNPAIPAPPSLIELLQISDYVKLIRQLVSPRSTSGHQLVELLHAQSHRLRVTGVAEANADAVGEDTEPLELTSTAEDGQIDSNTTRAPAAVTQAPERPARPVGLHTGVTRRSANGHRTSAESDSRDISTAPPVSKNAVECDGAEIKVSSNQGLSRGADTASPTRNLSPIGVRAETPLSAKGKEREMGSEAVLPSQSTSPRSTVMSPVTGKSFPSRTTPILGFSGPYTPSLLAPGNEFAGHQKSDKHVYNVNVEIKHVDMEQSFICGYLRIEGLTPDHPTLTTYFEGEIVGAKYSFTTQHPDWGSNNQQDWLHWNRFAAWKPFAKLARFPSFGIKNFSEKEHLFMRWKEYFLVPDHKVKSITGASFEGFYYICFNQRNGTFDGIYYHSKSERFQHLTLRHKGRPSGCAPAIELA